METKIGRIKYKKRVSKYPDYYKPTPECSYQGKRRGRKTNIEKYNEQKGIKIVKKEIVLDFN